MNLTIRLFISLSSYYYGNFFVFIHLELISCSYVFIDRSNMFVSISPSHNWELFDIVSSMDGKNYSLNFLVYEKSVAEAEREVSTFTYVLKY